MATAPRLNSVLWELAHEFRASIAASDPAALLIKAVDRGVDLPWRDVSAFAQSGGTTADIVDPAIVADFLIAMTANDAPKRTLDPWAGLGITLAALAENGRVAEGMAIEINRTLADLGRTLWPSAPIVWQAADASVALATDLGVFDLIVGSPPIGLPTTDLHLAEPLLDLRASKTYTMMIQASTALARGGTFAVVLPESFWWRERKVRVALAEIGVYPSASIALPRRSFGTPIPMCLAVFTRERTDLLFAAEVDPSTDMAAVVANLRSRRAGKLPQLGILTPVESFGSWLRLLRANEIEAAAAASGLRPVAVADVVADIRSARTDDHFDPDPAAVYLPTTLSLPAVTNVDALARSEQYLQVIGRTEALDPEYAAGFLNSPLGRTVREQLAGGAVAPKITISAMRGGTLYLPPTITQQRAVVRVGRQISDMQRAMGSLDKQLWDQPLAAARVQAKLKRVIEGDSLDHWMESLPFPLASILWRYVAEKGAERRCRYLVHVFEATTIFLVDLHLSAFAGDQRLIDGIPTRNGGDSTYKHGSIGIWADLLSRLAGRTRRLLAENPEYASEAFRSDDRRRLDAISNKALVAALKDDAASYRRDWIGHPAVVSRLEWERRLATAEATLARIRDILAEAFVGWQLIRPGAGSRREGVITTDVEYLVGSRSLFREGSVALRELPEEGGQYMLEDGATLLLPMRHLFQMRRAPESREDACYFYDRLEDGGVRWVSYHYEAEADVLQADADTVALIEELDAIG